MNTIKEFFPKIRTLFSSFRKRPGETYTTPPSGLSPAVIHWNIDLWQYQKVSGWRFLVELKNISYSEKLLKYKILLNEEIDIEKINP